MNMPAFARFLWTPWTLALAVLVGILLIVLAVRTRRRLWKIASWVCAFVMLASSCAGFGVASVTQVHPENRPAPVPDSLSVTFLRYPGDSNADATLMTTLNARTGSVRWQHAIDGRSGHSVADEHTIYLITDQPQTMVAVNASDGQVRWRTPLTNPLEPQRPLRFSTLPIMSDEMLFVSGHTNDDPSALGAVPGAAIFALRADTGMLAWTLPIKAIARNSETRLLAAEQGMLFFEDFPKGELVALRGSDGVRLWSAPGAALGGSYPTFAIGVACLLQANQIVGLDAHSGRQIWSYPVGTLRTTLARNPPDSVSRSVYFSSHGVVDNVNVNYLYSLNAQTGKLQWKYSITFEGVGGPSVTEAGDLVYFPDDTSLDAVRASDGHLVWQFSAARNLAFGTPVVVHGVLYANSYVAYRSRVVLCFVNCESDTRIYALNASTGALYWNSAWKLMDTSVPPWVTTDA